MATLLEKVKFKLISTFKKAEVIPPIIEKRKIIEHYGNLFHPDLFIETGTFLGDTVEYFKDKFDSIVSIELSEDLAKKAMNRFANDKNVQIIQGDSSKKLPSLIASIRGTVLFWLDGHYSSEFFVKNEYISTAKGETNTPIEKELEIILNSTIIPVILIDDARLFNGKNDYPSIATLKRKVNLSGRNFNFVIDNILFKFFLNTMRRYFRSADYRIRRIFFEKFALPKVLNEKISKVVLKRYLPSRPVIIDCGAHDGADTIELAHILKHSTVHAFEPVETLFNKLKARPNPLQNIKYYRLALADKNGKMDFYVSEGESDASSSLLQPKQHLLDHPETVFNSKIIVKTSTLDSWANENGIEKVDLLWLDMQGFELNMLKESKAILNTVSVIHTEVSTRETYKGVAPYATYRSFLEERGFKVKIEAIPKGWDMGNVLFVREKKL